MTPGRWVIGGLVVAVVFGAIFFLAFLVPPGAEFRGRTGMLWLVSPALAVAGVVIALVNGVRLVVLRRRIRAMRAYEQNAVDLF